MFKLRIKLTKISEYYQGLTTSETIIGDVQIHFTFTHLADALIQSDLQ